MIDGDLFSIIFCLLACFNLYNMDVFVPEPPYWTDPRPWMFTGVPGRNTMPFLFLNAVVLFSKSVRGYVSIYVYLLSMWFDKQHYPLNTTPMSLINRVCEYCKNIGVGIVIGVLLKAEAPEYTLPVIVSMCLGMTMFVYGFVQKTDYDELIYFPGGFERRLIDRESDLTAISKITCPQYRYRIIQVIGFALLSGNKTVYFYAFYMFTKYWRAARNLHRAQFVLQPEHVQGKGFIMFL